MPWELGELMDPDMARAGLETLQPLIAIENSVAGIVSDRMKVSSLEINWYLRNQLLRDADWAGMAHSLEIRTPLVDVVLLKKLMPLLASAHPLTKQSLANSPARKLPASFLNRPKTGFKIPVREWLLQSNPEYASYRGYRGWAQAVLKSFA